MNALYIATGEEGTEARVYPNDAHGFAVSIWDTDCNESLGMVFMRPTLESAIAKADEIKPRPAGSFGDVARMIFG